MGKSPRDRKRARDRGEDGWKAREVVDLAREDEIGMVLSAFRESERRFPARSVLAGEVRVPAEPGVYAWFFEPARLGIRGGYYEVLVGGEALIYVGMVPSRSDVKKKLRDRMRNHLRNSARQSTLRLSLGALLIDKIPLEPVAYGDGRVDFGATEPVLTSWIAEHGHVSWMPHPSPWQIEGSLVRALGVPLNLYGNEGHPFFHILAAARARVREKARNKNQLFRQES